MDIALCSLCCLQFVLLLTYRTRRVLVLDLEQVHGPDHGLHRHEDVLVDQLDVRPLLLIWKASSVDDLHLLDERRLARLASTYGKTQILIQVCLCKCGKKTSFYSKVFNLLSS